MSGGRLCLAVLTLTAAHAVETLDQFRPSPLVSPYGTTSDVEFTTGLVELEPGSLAHHLPRAMHDFRFPEPVWVIRYRTDIQDSRGQAPRQNYLCHTFFADQRVDQHDEHELRGIYSDAFTPEVRLPEGYGIQFLPHESLHWMPMFNNRGDQPVRVAMKLTMTVIRARDLKKPLKALYGSLRSVQAPHLFFVPPGRDEREVQFVLPFDGKIHFLGTHLHPYGASVELHNMTRREQVWKGSRTAGPESPMPVYSSAEGYRVKAGDHFAIRAVYDNPTKDQIDAMAGLFMLYSRN